MEQDYAAIGRAVAFAQIFETVLIPIFEFFKMQTEPGYLGKTGGYISDGAFKVPIKSIVKKLSEKGDIAPELEARLNSYIENRHKLIHRWFKENGWPDENDSVSFAPIVELANRVEREAKELTILFSGYMARFDENEWSSANSEKYKTRMAAIFQNAHIEQQKK